MNFSLLVLTQGGLGVHMMQECCAILSIL